MDLGSNSQNQQDYISPDIYNQGINNLQTQIDDLTSQLNQQIITPPTLQYPLDTNSYNSIQQSMPTLLSSQLMQTLWTKTFHYLETFPYTFGGSGGPSYGFNATTDGGGFSTVSFSNGYLTLNSGATTNNYAELTRSLNYQGLMTFSQPSFMRSGFQLEYNNNETVYIVVGTLTNKQYYGFKIVNGTLYGVSSDGTNESTVPVEAVVAGKTYNIEARYYPRNKIDFYVDDPNTTPYTVIRNKCSKSLNLPSSAANANYGLYDFKCITTGGSLGNYVLISVFEYLQARNIEKY